MRPENCACSSFILALLRTKLQVGVYANFCLARRVENNHIMASSGCEFVTFFLSSPRVSRRLHSRILALGSIRFGGCFGWHRFRCSQLRRDSMAAPLFSSARSPG